jgi:hypothetical protein
MCKIILRKNVKGFQRVLTPKNEMNMELDIFCLSLCGLTAEPLQEHALCARMLDECVRRAWQAVAHASKRRHCRLVAVQG